MPAAGLAVLKSACIAVLPTGPDPLVVPHNSNLKIMKILRFQVVPEGDTFSIVLQVEIERNTSMSSMVIKMREEMTPSEEE